MKRKSLLHNFLILFLVAYLFTVLCFDAEAAYADNATAGDAKDTSEENNEELAEHINEIGYAVKLYNADNGLPTSEANCVMSSKEGYIWIGGYSGLIKYDGNTFERQDSSQGLTSINTIFEDSKGRLWVGTNDNGIICLDKTESTRYSYEDGLDSSSITSIAEDKNGNIIVGTKQGLFYFDEDMNIGQVGDFLNLNSYIVQLDEDIDGDIIGVTGNGMLFYIKDLKVTECFSSADIGTDIITAILSSPDTAGEIWFGTNAGCVYHGSFKDSFSNIEKMDILFGNDRTHNSEPITRLLYAGGRIWVTTNSRIFYSDPREGFILLENSLLDGGIEHLTEDWEGNLWFTSRRQGVMKVSANKFQDLTGRAGLENKVVNTTCRRDELMYIGTDTGLQITNSKFKSVTNELTEYLADTRIRCIMLDNDNNLWLSTYTNDMGLICYTPYGKIISYTVDNGMPSNFIRCTCIAPDGAILAATNGGLAVIRDGKVDRIINEQNGLNNTVILTVEATEDGKYYLGSDGDGIYIVDGNKLQHIYHEDGLTSDVVLRIKEDKERGVIWIVTSNSIEYMQDGELHAVKNFPYTNNYDMYFDKTGNAWVLASNGIYVAKAADMIRKAGFEYSFYNVSNGLYSVPTGNSFSHLDDNGDLYIAGSRGVSIVNINEFFVQSSDIKFSLPFVESEGKRYYPDNSGIIRLPSTADNITIYAYAMSYKMHDPEIQYCLIGADNEPIIIKRSEMVPVRYTNLRGGNYEFEMDLLDSSNHEIRQKASFRIVKTKAFYEQWGFYLMIFALTLIVLSLLVRHYLNRKTEVFKIQEKEHERLKNFFEQTAAALVNAIDAKDKYTHGHSSRVAEYSKKIAEEAGKSEQECEEIYYAALLHDVGKIGIPGRIINKEGRLTDEEYDIIKHHPVLGAKILQGITEFPFLSIGASHHHERYDGKGYPDNLKGEEIPDIARIIAVADAYDAMTSKRSYRDPIPQDKVREELVKGIGAQFDPTYARIMLHLLDMDSDYEMKEHTDIEDMSGNNEFYISAHRSLVSDGIQLTPCMLSIELKVNREASSDEVPNPAMIIFDSLDGKYHDDDFEIKDLLYFEYGEAWFDGNYENVGCRKIISEKYKTEDGISLDEGVYRIEAVKKKDLALIRVIDNKLTIQYIMALPDSSRFVYLGFTGEHCSISDVMVGRSEEWIADDYIPRIAPEITFIDGPSGDVPNVQLDGYRTDSTEGIPLKDGMSITFHTMSLPTSRLVWHCPFINIFSSDDGTVKGENFRDYSLMRLDGECWDGCEFCEVKSTVNMKDGFADWEAWKKLNKDGYDCTVTFEVRDKLITARTENAGITIECTSRILDDPENIYVALTGDQCAITNIRISLED